MTIYLVDVNYEGILGTPVMGEIQRWFTKNMPEVKTVLKLKRGNYATDDPALWKEIKDNRGDGVILGVAG
jgi:phage gp16-like protein